MPQEDQDGNYGPVPEPFVWTNVAPGRRPARPGFPVSAVSHEAPHGQGGCSRFGLDGCAGISASKITNTSVRDLAGHAHGQDNGRDMDYDGATSSDLAEHGDTIRRTRWHPAAHARV